MINYKSRYTQSFDNFFKQIEFLHSTFVISYLSIGSLSPGPAASNRIFRFWNAEWAGKDSELQIAFYIFRK